jgi:hypothetical protein
VVEVRSLRGAVDGAGDFGSGTTQELLVHVRSQITYGEEAYAFFSVVSNSEGSTDTKDGGFASEGCGLVVGVILGTVLRWVCSWG